MRLIDADAVLDGLAHKLGIRSLDYLTKQEETIVGWFENAPTVDAVPVVRCRDCKYWKDKTDTDGDRVWCTELAEYMRMDEYCSRGERKDDE